MMLFHSSSVAGTRVLQKKKGMHLHLKAVSFMRFRPPKKTPQPWPFAHSCSSVLSA